MYCSIDGLVKGETWLLTTVEKFCQIYPFASGERALLLSFKLCQKSAMVSFNVFIGMWVQYVCVCASSSSVFPAIYLGSPFLVRVLRMWLFFNPTIKVVTFSSWMVHAGCVFVTSIHPSRTWMLGSFQSVRWNACVNRLDFGLYSHPKEFWGMESKLTLTTREKSPLPNPWHCITQNSKPNTLSTELSRPRLCQCLSA